MHPLTIVKEVILLLESGVDRTEIAKNHPDWVTILKDNKINIEKID